MPHSRPGSVPATPWILAPLVQLLLWTGKRLHGAVGLPRNTQRSSVELGGTALFVGGITAATLLALPPVLTLSGGLVLAVLFVIARSWIVARERPGA